MCDDHDLPNSLHAGANLCGQRADHLFKAGNVIDNVAFVFVEFIEESVGGLAETIVGFRNE